jgi:site-specific recombinase XerD
MRLNEALQLFLGQYKPSSARSYRAELAPMVAWIGNRDLVDVAPVDLLRYVAAEINGRELAPATRLKRVKAIKTFFRWCESMDFIEDSPARKLRNPRDNHRETRNKAMSEDHLRQLIAYAAGETPLSKARPRDLALFLFMYDTGLRVGAVASMTVKSLYMEERLCITRGKNDRDHVVTWGDWAHEALVEWLDRRSNELGLYVWHPRGKPMLGSSISQIIRRACKALGLPSYGGHALRHALGHRAGDDDANIRLIQAMLGHANSKDTESYVPLDQDAALRRMRKLSMQKPANFGKTIPFDPNKKAT